MSIPRGWIVLGCAIAAWMVAFAVISGIIATGPTLYILACCVSVILFVFALFLACAAINPREDGE
jgi:hypothetical protein